MQSNLETELSALLNDLSSVQEDTLDMLSRKSQLLALGDVPALDEIAARERELIARLETCLAQREDLLARANQAGQAAASLRDLARRMPAASSLAPELDQAAARSRVLQHHSLTNWLLTQRTLVHLGQMLEIFATGGRAAPTYGRGAVSPAAPWSIRRRRSATSG